MNYPADSHVHRSLKNLGNFRPSDIRVLAILEACGCNSKSMSIIKTSLFTISEWLLIGGQGSEEILKHALLWSEELIALDLKSFDGTLELFPAFTRLALVLGRCCLDYSLFKVILVMANSTGIEEDKILEIVENAFTFIMSLRIAALPDLQFLMT